MDLSPRDDEGGYKLYHYDPTIPGAVVIAIAFGLTTTYHVWQLIRTRCWMALPIVIGGFCNSSTGMDAILEYTADQLVPVQIIGYAARAVSGQQSPNWTLGPYIIQAIFLLVAPALYAATIYMEFGRIVTLVDGKQHTLIRHQWITKIFVAGDVLSFLLQGGGGGYQSSGTASALATGTNIIIVGLFVQLSFFGFFMFIAGVWYMKMLRFSSYRAYACPWNKLLCVLFGTSVLIMVRSVFRAVEYLQGNDGEILAHEAYLYVLDALLMLVVMVIFNVVHPSEAAVSQAKHNDTRDTLDLHLDQFYQGP